MSTDDERFENYLREFEPRRPRSFNAPAGRGTNWRQFAAAAAVAIAAGASVWIALRPAPGSRPESRIEQADRRPVTEPSETPRNVTLQQLNRLAEQPERLENTLARASREELPDFRESTSVLRVLAKE